MPHYKKGDGLDIHNYNLVSAFSVFSKVLEKIMHHRLLAFLKKFYILAVNKMVLGITNLLKQLVTPL